MVEENDDLIHLHGHLAKMPKNTKASSALNFLEKIKISKQKLWYVLIEKQNDELQMIKYNNKKGFNLKTFLDELKVYYSSNESLKEYIEKLEIDGNDKFSIIKNIPNVDVNGKKLITILTEDLIKLLK
jgi:hypothetical protein